MLIIVRNMVALQKIYKFGKIFGNGISSLLAAEHAEERLTDIFGHGRTSNVTSQLSRSGTVEQTQLKMDRQNLTFHGFLTGKYPIMQGNQDILRFDEN